MMRCLDGTIDSMGMSLSKLGETVMDRGSVLLSTGSQRVGHDFVTEQQLTQSALLNTPPPTPGSPPRLPYLPSYFDCC